MTTNKLLGSTLLISGTTIGGGMLALPIVTGIYGSLSAIFLLTAVWAMNTYIAFLLLEVNLQLSEDSNLISMARQMLGRPGEVIAWLCCLLFLYALLIAYTSGLGEMFIGTVQSITGKTLSNTVGFSVVILLFAVPVYLGARLVDYTNRLLMTGLVTFFIILMTFVVPHIQLDLIFSTAPRWPIAALPVVFTAFGYLIVIPTVRSYLNSDPKKIKKAILWGSLIPLIVYLIWIIAIIGIVPNASLEHILQQGDPGTGIINTLQQLTDNAFVLLASRVFVFFCVATSFIGVSLGLFDLLADGLGFKHSVAGRLSTLVFSFLPVLLFGVFYPHIFIAALGIAGLFIAIPYGVFPALMVWKQRYIENVKAPYRVPGGRVMLVLVFLFSLYLIVVEVMQIINH